METQSVSTQLSQPLGIWSWAFQQEKQEQTVVGRGNFRGWGQWEDEDAHSYLLGSPQPAVVIYNLMQTTVSALKDLIYFSSSL